jgi:Ca-activated chloride channel family protein
VATFARWLLGRSRWVLAVAAALVALAVVATAVVVSDRGGGPGGQTRPVAAAQGCPAPVVLPVLTGPMMESMVRRLAVAFQDSRHAPCRSGDIEVFPAPSSSEAVNVIAVDWTRDARRRLGPRPSVWLPDSSLEVERVNAKLSRDDKKLAALGSIATDPVVLAVPRAVRARLRLDRSVPWDTILRWGRRPADDPQALRIVRADPASSTAALLATAGLYGAAGDPHAVERVLERAVGDETVELCDREQMAGAGGRPPRAVLVAEQAVLASNRGALGGPCGTSRPAEPQRLEAIYPADGTPVLDYPYVLLPAASELPERERLAREFYAFLQSPPAQRALLQAGFRNQSLRVAPTIGEQDGIQPERPNLMTLPRGPAVTADLNAWDRARLPVSALLAIDVSGSMKETFQGPGGTRISAARSAATRAVKLIGDRDQIGLMRFSTRLDGDRDYQDLVPLGMADSLVAGRRRRDQVQDTLRRLRPTGGDTGLYDTMLAGIQRLRSARAGEADAVKALVVVTDGQNDDPSGGAGIDEVLTRLDEGDQVLVFLLTFGPVRCGTGALRELDRDQDVHCLDADRFGLDSAFDQVSATLWGTSRAGAGS